MQKNLITIYIACIGLLLSSCTSLLPEPHKIDIQQGNQIKQAQLDKLKLGMSQDQVKFVLGTPLLKDGFNANRWDYMYYLKPGKSERKSSRIVLYFNADKLIEIDRSNYVAEQQINASEDDEIK